MTNDFDNWEDYSDDYEDSQTRGNIPQITEGVQLSSLTEAMNAKQCNGNKKKNGKKKKKNSRHKNTYDHNFPYDYPRGSFDQGEGTKSYSKENNKAKLNLNKQKHLNGLNGLNGDARYHVTQCATNQTNAKSKEDSNCAEGWDVRSFNKNYNCSENFTQSKGNYFQDKRKYSKQSLNSKTEEVYPNNNYNCSQVEIIAENNKSNTTNTKDKKVYLKSTRKIEIIESNQQKTNKEILIVPREEELQKEPQTNKYKSKSFKKNKKGKYIDVYSLALEDKEFSKENQKKVKKSSGKVICVEVPYPNDTILKDELGVSKEHDSKTKEEQMKLHNSNAGNISVESNNEKEDKLLTTPSIPCINERPAIESPKRDDYTSSLTSKLDLNTQVNLPDSRVEQDTASFLNNEATKEIKKVVNKRSSIPFQCPKYEDNFHPEEILLYKTRTYKTKNSRPGIPIAEVYTSMKSQEMPSFYKVYNE